MKKLKVFFVVFFAAIMLGIGTGVVTVQAYKVVEPNYLAIGLSMLTQNRNSAVVNPLDSETIARIENGSLTLQEIDEFKSTLQDSVNQGFKKWQMQHSRVLMNRAVPDNETARSMLFSFLDQNPEYREQFKLYDQLLSLEIEQKIENMTRQVHESFKNIDLIIGQGKLVREWNTTTTINGENCTAINRVYELEINGTIQTVIKISIYSPNGTELMDPYVYLIVNPLVYWGWFWGGWFTWYYLPVLYGYDCLYYCRFPNNVGDPSEAWIYVYSVWADLVEEDKRWGTIASAITIIGSTLLAPISGIAAIAALAVATSMEVAEVGLGRSVESIYWAIWHTLLEVYAYNNEYDPDFGVEIMQRFHYVVTPQWWDLQSFTTYHFAYYNGATIQVSPLPPAVIPLDAASASQFWMETVMWIDLVGTNTWVWIGPLELPVEL